MLEQNKLVFIISQPRSGSTLLQLILDSHSRIYAPPEPWIMLPLYSITHGANSYSAILYPSGECLDANNQFAKNIGLKSFENLCFELALEVYRTALEYNKKDILVDKTPRYHTICEWIHHIFPEAKKIVLKRHPLDVIISLRDSWYNGNTFRVIKERKIDAITGALNVFKFSKLESDKILSIKYEDLVTEPDKIIHSVCKFLEVDYEPQMLYYGNFKHQFKSQAHQFGDKLGTIKEILPHKKSLFKWKNDKDKEFLLDLIEFFDEGFFENYGYQNPRTEISYVSKNIKPIVTDTFKKNRNIVFYEKIKQTIKKIPFLGFLSWWIYMILKAPSKMSELFNKLESLEEKINSLEPKNK